MKIRMIKTFPVAKGRSPRKGKIYDVVDYDYKKNIAYIKVGKKTVGVFVNQKRKNDNEADIVED